MGEERVLEGALWKDRFFGLRGYERQHWARALVIGFADFVFNSEITRR